MPQFDDHVFINCPIDRDYKPIFDALVFAVHDCGFVARSALEASDGAEVRIEKIFRIISECRVGIHDISRIEPDPQSGLPRFNMPLELGLFLGARRFGGGRQKEKVCLILEREPFEYQKYCSDIAGQDIWAHFGNPDLAIHAVRNALASLRSGSVVLPGAAHMIERYAAFRAQLPSICRQFRLEEDALSFFDFGTIVSEWLALTRQDSL